MMPKNFKKKGYVNNKKPSYLRYDDVFMSKKSEPRYNNSHLEKESDISSFQKPQHSQSPFENESFRNTQSFQNNSFRDELDDEVPRYFSNSDKNIIDERMLKYQKRQLPSLQRYQSNSPKDMYEEYSSSSSYWDEYDDYTRNSRYRNSDGAFLKSVWQKFLITFGSISLLVCVSWIAYNYGSNGNKSSNNVGKSITIEPETSTFKVLPDNPGGVNIPHQDKMIYDKINGQSTLTTSENHLLPPIETPNISDFEMNVDEYSIIDEKTYYIKLASNKSKEVLINELNITKNKYFNQIGDLSCSIKAVRDKSGEKRYAMLIGPIDSKNQAIKIAKTLNIDCSVISVKE